MDKSRAVTMPRLRTRKQVDDYFRDYHYKLKGRTNEEPFVLKNESDVELRSKISDEDDFEGTRNYKRKGTKRIRKGDVKSTDHRKIRKDKKQNIDVLLLSDDEVEYLGEEVVSNGSSFKVMSESRSGSSSKIDDPSEFVSHKASRIKEQPGVASPEINVTEAKVLFNEIESSSDATLLEIDSTSKDTDESTDEDYKEDKPASVSSDVSDSDSDSSFVKKIDDGSTIDVKSENLSNFCEDDKNEKSEKTFKPVKDHVIGASSGKIKVSKIKQEILSNDEGGSWFIANDTRVIGKKSAKQGRDPNSLDCVDMNSMKFKFSSVQPEAMPNNNDETGFIVNAKRKHGKKSMKPKKRDHEARNLDVAKILLESMYSTKMGISETKEEKVPSAHETTLSLKFRFEDEVELPPEKSEWDRHVDSLFCEMEFALRLEEPNVESTSFCVTEEDSTMSVEVCPADSCRRGQHVEFLDEQIGVLCKHCAKIILDVKYVIPPFHKPCLYRQNRRAPVDEFRNTEFMDHIQFDGSVSEPPNSAAFSARARGTVWDLIDGIEELYPHQREGFEFMWKNIGGDLRLEKLKQPLSDGVRGCIISHAPGTGKTRLSIVFLQSFLKLYPRSCPVIVAPRGMILTWESEFKKWNVDIPFHNLNKKDVSGNESSVASNLFRKVSDCKMDTDSVRLLKLYSWIKGSSVLGISYTLFEQLVGKNQTGVNVHIRRMLLEFPDVLVLDEGHTPRNDQSKIWNAFMEVSTPRRIILSGTPFQNNLRELYSTFRLVNPGFENQITGEDIKSWACLSSISKLGNNGLVKLKQLIQPFVHVHKGTILQESLPGLRCAIVFLQPTELQKQMLESASHISGIFSRIHLVSLISVHPSLTLNTDSFGSIRDVLKNLETVTDAGVKIRFLIELILLADALGERVLIFSQYIDPLVFIKKRIESQFSWHEGREVLYMDGKNDEKVRQNSISSFNDCTSEAKVLLASERACSEGINLVGASRVVLLDTVWNPSVEKQAISRSYRLGQKKVVYVYRLFTSGTEVKQYAHQVRKKRISDLIFSSLDGESGGNWSKSKVIWQDRVLDSMMELDRLQHIFERVIHQGMESDFVDNFGLADGF